MGYRERFPKVCEIPFNSTNKFQVCARRAGPARGSVPPTASPVHCGLDLSTAGRACEGLRSQSPPSP